MPYRDKKCSKNLCWLENLRLLDIFGFSSRPFVHLYPMKSITIYNTVPHLAIHK